MTISKRMTYNKLNAYRKIAFKAEPTAARSYAESALDAHRLGRGAGAIKNTENRVAAIEAGMNAKRTKKLRLERVQNIADVRGK